MNHTGKATTNESEFEMVDLITSYYQLDRDVKLESRQQLAEKMGISVSTLRIRAFRHRQSVQAALARCLEQQEPEEPPT